MLCKSVRIENRSVRMFYPRPSHHCAACLQVVFRQIPKDERPRNGRMSPLVDLLLPVIEKMFDLPSTGPKEGTEEWLQEKEASPISITFRQMVYYPRLMRAFVRDLLRRGDERGYIYLKPDDVVPDHLYDPDTADKRHMLQRTKRSMDFHSGLRFFRAGAANYAIEKLREMGLTPYNMKTSTLPPHARKKGWNNFGKVYAHFLAYYCYAQGLPRSHALVRQSHLYLCHGRGVLCKKMVPCIAIIHKKIQCGLHRFTEVGKIDKHWKTFKNLLAKKPAFETYLDDKGVGKAPNAYLIAVERSLRQFGEDRFAMGTFAMDSKSEWHNKKLVWKKIECYIAFVRHFKGHDSYGKYQHFYWQDYLLRNALRATFIKRHLDYSNGTKTLKGLPMPNNWKNPVNRRKRKQPSQRKSKTKSKKSKPPKTAEKDETEKDETAEAATVEKVWDSETEEWVPL